MQIIPEMPRLMDICRPEAGVTFLDFMVKLRERFIGNIFFSTMVYVECVWGFCGFSSETNGWTK